jgi:hypothetical protein
VKGIKEPTHQAPRGFLVAFWQNSLSHSLLLSRVFRGIKPSPMRNTKSTKTDKKGKAPDKLSGNKAYKKQKRDNHEGYLSFVGACLTKVEPL